MSLNTILTMRTQEIGDQKWRKMWKSVWRRAKKKKKKKKNNKKKKKNNVTSSQ